MPITRVQSEVLKLLASRRDPESYVAGGLPLVAYTARLSTDIDVFHDREERVAEAAIGDAKVLADAGYKVDWKRQQPLIYSALVTNEAGSTRLEWVGDSDFRFFPVIPDEVFGYVLHPVDLATNKVMAAAGRRELRDLVDTVTVHETILPLGALVWAAVEKAPGFTPEGLIGEIRRNSNYPREAWDELPVEKPLDPVELSRRLRAALEEAETFVMKMPTELVGMLFLKDGRVVQPNPDRLVDYETHRGRRRGHWPGSPEVMSAMLESYRERSETD